MTSKQAALSFAWAWIASNSPAAGARAGTSPGRGHVQLDVVGCPAVPAAVVWRALSVEIGDMLLDSADGEARDAERLTIRCAGNFASVEAHGPSDEPSIERILRLDEFPGDAAPRALALLGLELLAARSAAVRERIQPRQTGAVLPLETMVASPASRPPATAQRQVRVGAAGVWRTFPGQVGASALGGRIEASSTAARFALISGDAEIAVGSKDIANVGQTTALLISSAATVGLVAGRRRWRAAAGLGGRVGLVRESGTSADPARISGSTFVRPWGGPMLNARVRASLGRVGLTMGGEAGWSLSSIDEVAAGATAIAVHGPWFALSLGADF